MWNLHRTSKHINWGQPYKKKNRWHFHRSVLTFSVPDVQIRHRQSSIKGYKSGPVTDRLPCSNPQPSSDSVANHAAMNLKRDDAENSPGWPEVKQFYMYHFNPIKLLWTLRFWVITSIFIPSYNYISERLPLYPRGFISLCAGFIYIFYRKGLYMIVIRNTLTVKKQWGMHF